MIVTRHFDGEEWVGLPNPCTWWRGQYCEMPVWRKPCLLAQACCETAAMDSIKVVRYERVQLRNGKWAWNKPE